MFENGIEILLQTEISKQAHRFQSKHTDFKQTEKSKQTEISTHVYIFQTDIEMLKQAHRTFDTTSQNMSKMIQKEQK